MFSKVRWGISERDRQRSERIRRVGKARFIIIHGVLLRGCILFALAMLLEALGWHKQLSPYLIETNLFIWFFGALVGGFWMWDRNEITYRATHPTLDKYD